VRAAPAAQVLGSEREGEADGSGREGLDCRGHERCIPDGTSSLTPKVTPRGIWSAILAVLATLVARWFVGLGRS
jgi:hypothetical protein